MKPLIWTLLTPNETAKVMADRAKALRLLKEWKRETLVARAGVSPALLKRFENTGKASLQLVLKSAKQTLTASQRIACGSRPRT